MSSTIEKLMNAAYAFEAIATDQADAKDKEHVSAFDRERLEHEEWAKKNPPPSKWTNKEWSEYLRRDKEKATKKELTNDFHNPAKRTAMVGGRVSATITKQASVKEVVDLLMRYPSTTDFLKDVAAAQFNLSGVEATTPEAERDDTWMEAKAMHDAIMGFANEFHNIEAEFV